MKKAPRESVQKVEKLSRNTNLKSIMIDRERKAHPGNLSNYLEFHEEFYEVRSRWTFRSRKSSQPKKEEV